jgi:hypothetical protein
MRSFPRNHCAHGVFHLTSTQAQDSTRNRPKTCVDRTTFGRCVLDPTARIRRDFGEDRVIEQVSNYRTAGAVQAYSSGSVYQDSNGCINASARPAYRLKERVRWQGDNLDSVSVVACVIGSSGVHS